MSKGKGIFKLVEENPQGTQNSSVGSDKNMIISNKENEEKKDEENINESNIDSNKDLKSKKKAKTARETRKNFAQEIIEEKRKERTMRAKIDKIYIETERLTKKFEEKNSFIHLFVPTKGSREIPFHTEHDHNQARELVDCPGHLIQTVLQG